MHDASSKNLNMLLVEEQPLLRKTVSMTARSLGIGTVHEAATVKAAERMLREHAFQGAVISIDCSAEAGCFYNLALLDKVRNGMSASDAAIPIAVMVDQATADLMRELRDRHVNRVILKPFRARILLEAFESFGGTATQR
ncbi:MULTISPECIES: response regulator [unclassified Duganella]|uniref:response regulator n=1 Tax=unclassified Duganella TaxID=2636909 RepID=UPI00087E1C80|nr:MULTISPECIES: response regulator [unclassified Duganella]SDG51320.1 Response regulator receiver domain-containing protein [Duganella sp. OV458]SDJ73976.1 Response regulator receiver domain-containing protein [Duganella sp. OV510]